MARLLAKASEAGAQRLSVYHWRWEIAGDCTAPVTRDIVSRPVADRQHVTMIPFPHLFEVPGYVVSVNDYVPVPETVRVDAQVAAHLELTVRCRKCDRCRAAKAYHWQLRAVAETRATFGRTWFVTYTFAPEWQARATAWAELQCRRRRNEPLDAQDAGYQFLMRHRYLQRQLTLMFKRMRRGGTSIVSERGVVGTLDPMVFRYLLVAEAHKSGLPHYHALIHEGGSPIRKKELEASYACGFMKAVLVEEDMGAVRYVCKYVAKNGAARVRASQGYGSGRVVRLSGSRDSGVYGSALVQLAEPVAVCAARAEPRATAARGGVTTKGASFLSTEKV